MRPEDSGRRSIQSEGESKCKGPEAVVRVACLRNRKAASMA